MVKVIASGVRKGNVIEHEDGKLYVVLSAENFHPGKGTPTTSIDMRRISDGVKVSIRHKTTEQMEKAFVEERDYTYLYDDGTNFVFMDPGNYEQLEVSRDVVGDWAPYLLENMTCVLSMHEGKAISIELPTKVTLEITDTEPAVKGQTAANSYKPAVLSNGVRTAVPQFIAVGEKIIVNTTDGSYVKRAD
jgi:elongation factor P